MGVRSEHVVMPVDVTDWCAGCMGGWEIIFMEGDHLGGV